MAGAARGLGVAYPSGAPELTPGFVLYVMILIVCIASLFQFADSSIQSCYGNNNRAYLFAFLPLEDTNSARHLDIYVMLSGRQTAKVRARTPAWNGVSSFDASFDLPYGATAHLEIPPNLIVAENEIDVRTVEISAEDDIVIYYRISQSATSGMYTILPSAFLGTDYYVITYQPTSGTSDRAFVNIISSLSGETIVKISLPKNSSVTVTLSGHVFNSEDIITISLQQYQSIFISSVYDLTGSRVFSSKPVSVTSGNTALSTNGGVDQDYVIEQMIPVHLWGTEYLVVPYFSTENELIRAVAASKVDIIVNDSITFSLDAGEYFDFEISAGTTAVALTSSSPILIGHYSFLHSDSQTTHADATFMVVPHTKMFTDEYVFVAPISIRDISYKWNLIATFQSGGQNLLLDLAPIPGSSITWFNAQIDQYTFGVMTSELLNQDVHVVSSPSDVFGGLLIGHSEKDNDSVSFTLAAVGKSTVEWTRQADDIYTTRFSSYLENQIPYETPLEEVMVKSTNGCHRECAENTKCSFVAVKKFTGFKLCKFYDSHLPCKAMFQETGYKLYQRHSE